MTFTVQDVVKADLVLLGLHLLRTPDELERFRQSINADVQITGTGLVANIASGTTEPGRSFAVNKDRITLESSQSRSSIAREYPADKADLRRLANVAWQAISSTSHEGQPLRAFGFNMEIIFDQHTETSAFGYLSRRLFTDDPLGNEGWEFVGGAGRLLFVEGGRRWTVSFEPRFNNEEESRVFMGVNLHIDERSMPDETELIALLDEIWDESHNFVARLDSRDTNNG